MHSISCVALNGTQVNVIPLFGKIGVVTVLVVEVSVMEVLVVEVVVAVVVVDIVADVEVAVVDVIVTDVVDVVSVVDVLVEVVSRDGSRTQNISRSDHDSSKVHTRSLAAPHVVSHSATPPPPPPSPASSSSLLPSSVSHLHSCGDVVATVVVVLPDDGSGQLQRVVEVEVEVEVDVVVSLSLSTKQCVGSRAKQVGKSVPWSHHSGNPADWSENDLKHRFISAPRVSSIAFLHSSCVAGMR